jgi:hypothetical protein
MGARALFFNQPRIPCFTLCFQSVCAGAEPDFNARRAVPIEHLKRSNTDLIIDVFADPVSEPITTFPNFRE